MCAGSELGAASGVLNDRNGERYVEDGKVITTAGVTSVVVGALRLVELLARNAEADRIGQELGFPGWTRDAPTVIGVNRFAPADLAYGLSAAFPWFRPTVAIGLNEGVGEIDVAAAFEVYSGSSFAAQTIPVAADRNITTRHGLVLIAELADKTIPSVDRLVVPGARHTNDVDRHLVRWAADRKLAVDLPHAGQADGEFGFDGCCATLPPKPIKPPPVRPPSSPSIRPTTSSSTATPGR